MLPGGLWGPAGLVRTLRSLPVSGTIELALADAMLARQPWPCFVDRMLALAYAGVGDCPWNEAQAAALCAGDRQYLLLQLATRLWGERFVIGRACAQCATCFELVLQRGALPVKPAGPGFPWVSVRTQDHDIILRLPTGADQMDIAAAREADPIGALLRRCTVSVDGCAISGNEAPRFTEQTRQQIDAAMDDVAPAVAQSVLTRCPECDHAQQIDFDPFGFNRIDGSGMLDDIHRLAMQYHWTEAEIVALPRERRQHYARLVGAAQGWMQ